MQDRAHGDARQYPAGGDLAFDPQTFAGSFKSPFRENLGFAKLNWQINGDQFLELTGSIRKEKDTRDFGGTGRAMTKASSSTTTFTLEKSGTSSAATASSTNSPSTI